MNMIIDEMQVRCLAITILHTGCPEQIFVFTHSSQTPFVNASGKWVLLFDSISLNLFRLLCNFCILRTRCAAGRLLWLPLVGRIFDACPHDAWLSGKLRSKQDGVLACLPSAQTSLALFEVCFMMHVESKQSSTDCLNLGAFHLQTQMVKYPFNIYDFLHDAS